MKLLDSLLDAIVRLEGDALVMHVGEKPYVVTASSSMNAYRGPLAWGQVELSSRVLTFDAVSSMLGQILPADQQQALTEFGAIEHEIPSPAGVADRFTVVAARGGEDVWVEVRRRAIEIPQPVAQADVPEPEVAATPAAVASVAETVAEPALAEIELVTNVAAETDLHPAANVQLDAPESIVVAIPGQAAEEFALNTVPDNAIQIVDDEPQGVPTEEEVDAMLAATATALLTSGLAGEVTSGDDVVAPPVAGQADVAPSEVAAVGTVEIEPPGRGRGRGASRRREAESRVRGDEPSSKFVAQAEPTVVARPSPKLWRKPAPCSSSLRHHSLFRVSEEATADLESVPEPPVGAPLFSEEAMLAAAPAPELVPAAAIESRACRAGVRRVHIRRAGVGRTRDGRLPAHGRGAHRGRLTRRRLGRRGACRGTDAGGPSRPVVELTGRRTTASRRSTVGRRIRAAGHRSSAGCRTTPGRRTAAGR